MADIAQQIRDARTARGWSQEDLAAQAGLSRPEHRSDRTGRRRLDGDLVQGRRRARARHQNRALNGASSPGGHRSDHCAIEPTADYGGSGHVSVTIKWEIRLAAAPASETYRRFTRPSGTKHYEPRRASLAHDTGLP